MPAPRSKSTAIGSSVIGRTDESTLLFGTQPDVRDIHRQGQASASRLRRSVAGSAGACSAQSMRRKASGGGAFTSAQCCGAAVTGNSSAST